MAITKCLNGHFFDDGKYSECPYCIKQQEDRSWFVNRMQDSVTVAAPRQAKQEEAVTVGLYEPVQNDEGRTVGIFSRKAGQNYVTGWLVCLEGKEKGRDYRLHNGYNWIGRSYQMDVCVVDDVLISRERHASIVYDHKSNCFFLSPGEGTVTRLNGEVLVKAGRLKHGDRISIGNSLFEFVPFCGEGWSWEKENG